MKRKIKKDGKGNIIISEDSFELLLSCLDNQKFINETPQNGDSLSIGGEYNNYQKDTQNIIDDYNKECRAILNQKYILRTENNGYFLAKKYENQTEDIEWTNKDMGLVYELFKDTRIIYKDKNLLPLDGSEGIAVKTDPTPWLIERPLRYDLEYLTISEDGLINRPWKQEEIDKISEILNK